MPKLNRGITIPVVQACEVEVTVLESFIVLRNESLINSVMEHIEVSFLEVND